MKSSITKVNVTINPEIKFTDNDLCWLLFGMSEQQLIHDIRINENGKYDDLYVKEC